MSRRKVTVHTAGKIRTMDPGRPEVDAVAVLDGKVLSTGSLESMQPWLEHYDVTVDDQFKDKVILPGPRDPYPGELGVVKEGALADLILVNGNPLENLDLVADPHNNFVVIRRTGRSTRTRSTDASNALKRRRT